MRQYFPRGLYVLVTERHDARRIDRQLFGRCGRQGDPGSFQTIVSLEDELVTLMFGDHAKRLATALWNEKKSLPNWVGKFILGIAQYFSELHNERSRRDLLKVDDHLSDLLAFTGRPE